MGTILRLDKTSEHMQMSANVMLLLCPSLASEICAILSLAPSRAAEFTDFAPALLVAYTLRMLVGMGLMLCYPQFITMVSDYTQPKDRGKGMAFNGIMMGLASIIIFGVLILLVKSGWDLFQSMRFDKLPALRWPLRYIMMIAPIASAFMAAISVWHFWRRLNFLRGGAK